MSSIDSAQNPTHQRFVRDLVVDSGFAAIFVNYTPSPEAHNPTAINEAYAATTWSPNMATKSRGSRLLTLAYKPDCII
jgi:acetyl esterase/lipase